MITCNICNKQFLVITHHVKTHGITVDEYRDMFPGSKTMDDEFANKRNNKIKQTCNTEDFKSKMSKISHEYNSTEEARKVLSDRMKKQREDPLFMEKSRESFKKAVKTEKHRAILRENAIKQWQRDYDTLSRKVGPHTWKSEILNKVFRSYAEKCLAEQLNYSGISYEYEPRHFEYYCKSKGKTRRYYPDFYLPEYKLYIEVKYTENDIDEITKEKVCEVTKQGYQIIVVLHNEIVKSPSIVTLLLNNDLDKFYERTKNILLSATTIESIS